MARLGDRLPASGKRFTGTLSRIIRVVLPAAHHGAARPTGPRRHPTGKTRGRGWSIGRLTAAGSVVQGPFGHRTTGRWPNLLDPAVRISVANRRSGIGVPAVDWITGGRRVTGAVPISGIVIVRRISHRSVIHVITGIAAIAISAIARPTTSLGGLGHEKTSRRHRSQKSLPHL